MGSNIMYIPYFRFFPRYFKGDVETICADILRIGRSILRKESDKNLRGADLVYLQHPR